MLLHQLD